MKLERVYPDEKGKCSYPPGSYGFENGVWYFRHPDCHLGSLEKHQVIVHGDHTITVSPSILHRDFKIVDGKTVEYQVHGFIERGIWRDC